MDIQILDLLDGAKKATGLTVIIDVFRAFSTACYAYAAGAEKIIPVALMDDAFRLKEQNPEFLLMGERNEIKPPGFDYGNSPFQIPREKLMGKTIVHTTSSGTQGIAAAVNASEIIIGSFVNAGAIVDYIQTRNPSTVSLVCMGYACEYPTDEDTLCARFIAARLKGEPTDFAAMTETIRKGSGSRFFDPAKQEWAPQEDFNLCLTADRFDFVLKVMEDETGKFLSRINPPFQY